MKTGTIITLGIIGLGIAYVMSKQRADFMDSSGGGGGGGYMTPQAFTDSTVKLFNPKTQDVVPVSGNYNQMIFTPTSEGAADRFIIDPNAGGYGVQDRYAQQSIRTETANIRSIFGTPAKDTPQAYLPKLSTSQSQPKTVAPAIKKLFQTGTSLPQSIQK
jgi:hypothetical protein